MRGVGVTRAVAHAVPEVLVPLLFAVTSIGNPAFLAVLAPLVYWLGPRYDLVSRRDGAIVVAVTYVALAITLLLKAGFALPRPPASVMLIAKDGYGFPSGHATGATATYAALAVYLRWGSRRVRYALGALLFLVVAATRVLLGVHYLVDVVAGIGVGLLVLLVVRQVARDSIVLGFALAIPLALGGTVLSPDVESALQLGMVTGGTAGWWLVRDGIDDTALSLGRIAVGLAGGAILVGIGYGSGTPIVAGLTGLGTGALFVALPGLDS